MTTTKTALVAWENFTNKFCSIGYDPTDDVIIIEQALTANTWRDIKDAPRDGKPFIAWWPDQYHYPVVVFWADKFNPFIGWKVMGWNHEKFSTEPTHWQPLPEQPPR